LDRKIYVSLERPGAWFGWYRGGGGPLGK